MIAGKGYLFPDASYPKFRRTMKDVKPDLPDGQATHALRHSFATHFMINGGSIITLQRILGHSRIEQTMVYAHFAPEYLQDAVSLNPIRGGVDFQSIHSRVVHLAFSGLACRANAHCTAESPCYLPRKTHLRRLIFCLLVYAINPQ